MMIKNILKPKDLKLLFNQEFNFISDLLDNVNLPSEKTDDSDSETEDVVGEEFDEKNKKTKFKSRLKKMKKETIQRSELTKLKSLPEKLSSLKSDFSVSERKTPVSLPLKDRVVSDKKLPKPVFNGNGNLVFSKFDFLGETSTVTDKEILAKEDTRNKKQILEKFEKKKNYIKKLEETGEVEKASQIKEEATWKNVFRKAEGLKVKDDPVLLKKSLAKKENKKKVSQKKWKERVKTVEKQKVEKQKKRTENISKRIQEKKKKKLKKAAKKGRHIPKV